MAKTAAKDADLKKVLHTLLGLHAEYWALGRLFSEPAPVTVPLWGLFVIEESGNLHFISFEQENWFSALMASGRSFNKKSSNGIKEHLSFPRSERISLVQIKKRGLFSFLQKPFPLYHLKQKETKNKIVFELEEPGNDFLDALEIEHV